MKKIDLSDVICVITSLLILLMTVLSVLGTDRTPYKLWTGVLCAFFCLLPMIFRHANVMRLPLALIMPIQVTIFLHAYGVLLMMYDDIVWYDTVTHLAASITIALLVFYALVAIELFDKQTRFGKRLPLFVTLIMMTFSIYWEVLELVVDYTTGINMQYSPWDTIRDMVCNTIGTLMVTIPLRFYLKKHDPHDFIERLELSPSLKRIVTREPKKTKQPVDGDR
jgi:uncharacterized membrane protein YjdF